MKTRIILNLIWEGLWSILVPPIPDTIIHLFKKTNQIPPKNGWSSTIRMYENMKSLDFLRIASEVLANISSKEP